MSNIRHGTSPERSILVRSLGLGLRPNATLDEHCHDWGQVVFAISGVLTVATQVGNWVVPSHRAAWVPPGVSHAIRADGIVQMRTLYLHPELARDLPDRCCVLAVPALLREMILEVVRVGMLRADIPEEARLAAVLVDRVRVTRDAPLELPWPTDPRAAAIAALVRDDIESSAPLAELARGNGASPRTLERIFARETGLTFGKWRQQARLLAALRMLAGGASVTTTALSVGFANASAFIAMFRRALGATPGAYFSHGREAN